MTERSVPRRTVLGGAASAVASLAGCISTSPTPPSAAAADPDGGTGESAGLLKVGGSSTVYPITSKASSYWGSNFPPSDREYWGPGQYGIDTDEHLADYWASKYGFEPTETDGAPPFNVKVNVSHSGIGLENLKVGRLDIGDASAPVAAELDNLSESELDEFVDHVVGVDAQPIVVSPEIADAGVTKITAETLRDIYKERITDWSEVPGYDGPEKSIQAVGRAVGSGTDTSFRVNLFGNADAPIPGVDVRKGQNQQVASLVGNSDNAIGYMALAFVSEDITAIALEFEGTVYRPGENLADEDYPMSRDLHCYTHGGTSKMEAAYLRMILSDYGQEKFVKPSGYAALTDERQQNQIEKLPDPVQ